MTKLPKDIVKKIDSRNLRINVKFKEKLKQEILAKEDSYMAKTSNKGVKGLLKMFKYNFASIVLVMAVLFAVGGASAIVGSNHAKQANIRETSIPDNLNNVLSVDEIRKKATADFPSGTINGIELEQEDEGLVYKVKFSDGSVRLYNAITGEALVSKGDEAEKDDSVPNGFVSTVSLEEARDIALRQRPGKTIKKIELETEHGVVVYSIRFTDGGRVDVNAKDGSILRTEGPTQSGSSDDTADDSNSGSGSSNSGSSDDSSQHEGGDDNSGSGSSHSGDSTDN